MVSGLAQVVTSTLGSRVVSGVARRARRADLRILAYHDVPDRAAFAAQAGYLSDRFRMVSCEEVVGWLGGRNLGRRPLVWLTFDDADPSVVETGLPVLAAHDAPATLFQVAAVVDTTEPFWWQLVERAVERGAGIPMVRALKGLPDHDRRACVERARDYLAEHDPTALREAQMTSALLQRWLDSGRDVGSHTWDHPCLDQCTPVDARTQIERAATWTATLHPSQPRAFAYPNGNFDRTADAALRDLGYDIGLLAGHRLTPRSSDPLRLERLRVDADAPLARFRAVVSGAHSTVFHLRARG